MSENNPSNINNQIEVPQEEEMNFIPGNNNNLDYPYIKEKSHAQGERIIEIIAWKGIYYSLLVFLILEIIEIIIAFTLFRNITFLKWIFLFLLIPYFIPFLFIPVKAICKYDYNNKIFSSRVSPIIPITYSFYSININFEDISFFYFFKINKAGKKYYKIGINKKDGEDHDIILGQDIKCSREFDNKVKQIPHILKTYLRE